jgi:uncharacterized protein (DUF488 family)
MTIMSMQQNVIYTIGFTGKSAEEFFSLLKKAGIKIPIDIRLNNTSQLAGFTKGKDLAYFMKEILGGQYHHLTMFAPTKEMLGKYQKDSDWESYECEFAEKCHRRLVAEYIRKRMLPYYKIENATEYFNHYRCHSNAR